MNLLQQGLCSFIALVCLVTTYAEYLQSYSLLSFDNARNRLHSDHAINSSNHIDFPSETIKNDFASEVASYTNSEEQNIADLIGTDTEEIAKFTQQQPTDNRLSSADLLSLMVEALPRCNLLRLLQQDLYCTSSPVNVRNVLDLISLKPEYFNYCGWQFFVQPFYNQMSRAFFNHNNPFVKDALHLENPVLAEELTAILDDVNTLLPTPIIIDIPLAISLIKHFRLQERRAGAMFTLARCYGCFFFSFRIPFYYQEHNFFLTNSEISSIKKAPFFRLNGIDTNSETNPQPEIDAMLTKALVNDRFGFGDTRAKFLINIANNCYINAWLGIQATIPTAVDWRVGIVGGRCHSTPWVPLFELKALVNLALCDMAHKSIEMVTDFGVAALHRLASILINIPLGNEKHFGIGPYFECVSYLDEYWSTRTSARFEGYIPHTNRRFFIPTKVPADFQKDFTNPNLADAHLAFFNEQIINTLFPHDICVDVFPGFVFQVNHAFYVDNPCLHFGLGFDFWYKAREHLGISRSNTIGLFPDGLNKALRARAYQGKLYSEFGFHGISCTRAIGWEVLFTNDVTVFNKGIGKDFTLGLRIGLNY